MGRFSHDFQHRVARAPWPGAGTGLSCPRRTSGNRRPRCEVYAWTLHDTLPSIPIPLKAGDADAVVPLQEVFDMVYQRARYDLSVKYDATLDPPLNESELQLVRQQS